MIPAQRTPPHTHPEPMLRLDDTFAFVEGLLLDLTEQSARFGCGTDPWRQLAVYETELWQPFTEAEAA